MADKRDLDRRLVTGYKQNTFRQYHFRNTKVDITLENM